MKVNAVEKDYWVKEVNKHCYNISLHKLSPTEIKNWSNSKSSTEDWQNLDPYSSLEDMGDITSDELEHVTHAATKSDPDASLPDMTARLCE